MYLSKSYNTVCLRPESYNTVSPRPESCDRQRALMSITPNLCCDETEPRSIPSPDTREKGKEKMSSILLKERDKFSSPLLIDYEK